MWVIWMNPQINRINLVDLESIQIKQIHLVDLGDLDHSSSGRHFFIAIQSRCRHKVAQVRCKGFNKPRKITKKNIQIQEN